jgi:DNA repair exonuclease SbcCD ATPase subunit
MHSASLSPGRKERAFHKYCHKPGGSFFRLVTLLIVHLMVTGTASTVQAQPASYSYEVLSLQGIINDILRLKEDQKDAEDLINEQGILESQEAVNQQNAINALVREKSNALEELRKGYYCSECKRPKSQIERETGETFPYHLRRVKGVSLPATREMLDKKAEEYDNKISTLRKQLQDFLDLENAFDREKEKLRQKIENMEEQIRQLRMRAVQVIARWQQYWEDQYKSLKGRIAGEFAHEIIGIKRAEGQQKNLQAEYEQFRKDMIEKKDDLLKEARRQFNEKLTLLQKKKENKDLDLKSLHNQRKQQLTLLQSELDQLKQDLSRLESDFRLSSGKTGSDTLNYNARSRDLRTRIGQKENEYTLKKDEFDNVLIPRLTKEIEEIRDQAFGLQASQPAEEQKIASQIQSAISTREIIMNKAVLAAENNAKNLRMVMSSNSSKRVAMVSALNDRINVEKTEVNRLCALGGINNYGSVEVFIPWTVVENISNGMMTAADDALRSGTPYSTAIPGALDQVFDLTGFTVTIINNSKPNAITDNSDLKKKITGSKFDDLIKKIP